MKCETVLSNKCPDHTEKRSASSKITFFLFHSSSISASNSPRRAGMSRSQEATIEWLPQSAAAGKKILLTAICFSFCFLRSCRAMQTAVPWSNRSWISRSLHGSCGFTRRVRIGVTILPWGWSCTGVLPVSRFFHYTWEQLSPSILLPVFWPFVALVTISVVSARKGEGGWGVGGGGGGQIAGRFFRFHLRTEGTKVRYFYEKMVSVNWLG